MRVRAATRVLAGGAIGLLGIEAIGGLIDAGRRKPLLWHDMLTERKYLQMCSLAVRGGADVVTIGCSHSVLGVDTALVAEQLDDASGFNAALYRAMPNVASHWLRSVVLPLLRPKIVLWGLSPFHFNDNGILHREINEKYLAGAAHRSPRPVPWTTELLRRSFLARMPYAFGSGQRKETIRSLRQALADFRAGELSLHTLPGELGRRGLGNTTEHFSYLVTDRLRYVVGVETGADFEMRGEQMAHLEEGVRAAQAAGATVILVRMPLTDDATAELPRGELDLAAGDQAIVDAADRLGADVIDLSKQFTDVEHYADFVHLNGVGRRAFSIALGQAIRSRLRQAEDGADVAEEAEHSAVI